MLGGASTWMFMVAVVAGHTDVFTIFHWIRLRPCARLLTLEVGLLIEPILPLPATTLQLPVAVPVGVLPESTAVAVLKQMVWLSGPVMAATLGGASTCIVIVALDIGHATVLKVVQLMTLRPCIKLFTVVFAMFAFAMLPEPGGPTDQVPVVAPVMLLAANTAVGVLKQRV